MLPQEFKASKAIQVFADWWVDFESASLERPLNESLSVLQQGFESNFERAMGPNGPWLPRKDTKPHPLLILTGAMLMSVRDNGLAGHIQMVGYRMATTGINGAVVPYAAVHQFGGGRVPARTFHYADQETLDKVTTVFADQAFIILVGV